MNTKNNTNTIENISKPITMARDEFMEKLIKTANESGLPLLIIEYVARDFLNEVSRAAAQQAEQEKKNYQQQIETKASGDSK